MAHPSMTNRGVVAVTTVVVLPVLLFLFLATFDLGRFVYAKAQVRSAANASALAVVGEPSHWAIPIPKEFIWLPTPIPIPIPYDGWITNFVWLKNLDGIVSDKRLSGNAAKVVQWTKAGDSIKTKVSVLPDTILPSFFRLVKVTATVPTPSKFSKLLFASTEISQEACAMVWIRPDYWVIKGWWNEKAKNSTAASWLDQKSVPMMYYRMINCLEWKGDWDGVNDSGKWVRTASLIADVATVVLAEHLKQGSVDRKAAEQQLEEFMNMDLSGKMGNRGRQKPEVPDPYVESCEEERVTADPWAKDSSKSDLERQLEGAAQGCEERIKAREEREAREKAEKEAQAKEAQAKEAQAKEAQAKAEQEAREKTEQGAEQGAEEG